MKFDSAAAAQENLGMRNLRGHFIMNPAFQVRFGLLFTLAVLVFSLIFPIFVYTMLSSIQNHSYFAKNAQALQVLREARYDLSIFLLLTALVTAVTAFLLALFHSHRIAGPLYKLRMSMLAMQQGVLDRHIQFRDKDNFPELAEGFNAMTDAIFIRRRRDFERVHSVIPKLERLQSTLAGQEQAAVNEVLNALRELSREISPK
jgi:nitrogen fixation/metabolism regulation signal transduction histidine kinase